MSLVLENVKGSLKVETSRLHERVYDILRKGLMGGVFPPTQVLTIRELAAEMGTSVQPVRDALAKLASEGALEILPNRSLMVPAVTREGYEEIWRLRRMLEGDAARIAAARITSADLGRMEGHIREMDADIAAGDNARYLANNQQFHFCIYRAAQQPMVLKFIEALWLRIGPLMHFRQEYMDWLEIRTKEGQDHHLQILEALRQRDGEAACQAIMADIDTAANDFRRNYSFSA